MAFPTQANKQTKEDITRAEIFSLPVLLVLLVLIFRGLVAALTPLVIGGIAILGAFVAVRLLTYVTDISVFAINVITLLGLGMAVDYSLFIVSRFREELANGRDVRAPRDPRTVATAGRTVLVSGLTIVLALSSLLIFPQVFLGGMAIGGMAAVLVAMLAALTVLPALLWPCSATGSTRCASRCRRRRHPPAPARGWARLAHSVMRRPVLYVVGVLVGARRCFAAPFLRVEFGGFDERVLPRRHRGAGGRPSGSAAGVPRRRGEPDQRAGHRRARQPGWRRQIAGLPGVTGATVTAERGDSSLITVTYPGEPTGARVPRRRPADPRPAGRPRAPRCWSAAGRAVDLDLLDSLGRPAALDGADHGGGDDACCSSSPSARWCCRSRRC